MGQPELNVDPRFDTNFKRGKTNRAELMDIINIWSRTFTVDALIAALDETGIPSARYNELPDVWEDVQVKHRKLRATTPHPHAEAGSVDLIASPLAQMSASPATIRLAPPLLGEHNDDVLAGLLGYSAERIAELKGKMQTTVALSLSKGASRPKATVETLKRASTSSALRCCIRR
jgi:crotonobetainyl-CoA:carnitine CoA-transferase CaiB-like acyl-CoA transferase